MKQEIKEELVDDFKTAKKNKSKSSKETSKKQSSLNLEDVKTIEKTDVKNQEQPQETSKKEKEHKEKVKKKKQEIKHEKIMENMIQKRKNINILLSVLLLLVIVVIVFSTIFALSNLSNESIISNIYVSNIPISHYTKEEAMNKLLIEYNKVSDLSIILKFEDYTREVSPNDIDFEIQTEKTVAKAYNIGRTNNIFKNNFDILFSLFKNTDIEPEYTYDRQLLDQLISDISVKIPGRTIEHTYTIKKKELIINKGMLGINVITEELTDHIIKNFSTLSAEKNIIIPTKETLPEPLNIEKISKEITEEPQNATYDTKTKIITPETNGVKFAITLAEARTVLAEEKDKYIIPLTITKPKITTDTIKDKYNLYVFDDILAKETTYYDATYWTRSNNLEVATKQINGTIVKPGKEFSFNSFVGDTSAADGYQAAIGYAGGRSVPMMGGGVCQISSEIYSAALKANLKITERYNHVCPVSYLPPGQDAATDLGSCDLKFINNRKEAIKIVLKTGNGVSTVEIRGVKEPDDPVIKLSSTKISTVPFSTIYVQDSSLKAGKQVIDTYGIHGYTSKLYKETYVNGILINKSLISTDTYKPLHQVIRRNKK